MMLLSDLEKIHVKTPLGDDLGRVEDLIVDLETWNVKNIVLKEGLVFAKHESIKPSDVELDGHTMTMPADTERTEIEEDLSSIHHAFLSDIMKKDVNTSDDEKLGSVYDFEIATELKTWKAWKVLIHSGFMKRRLRLSPDEDIESIGEDINLKMSMDEVEDLSSPDLPERDQED